MSLVEDPVDKKFNLGDEQIGHPNIHNYADLNSFFFIDRNRK